MFVWKCYKTSQIATNQRDEEIKIICLVSLLYWSLSEGFLGWFEAFWAKNWLVLFFMLAERLELIKGRKQFRTAPHLKFDKFHHNKKIAPKLQMCILRSLSYCCSLSGFPDSILSCRRPLLNTKLAFPGVFIWSAQMNLCQPRFDDKIASAGERIPHKRCKMSNW